MLAVALVLATAACAPKHLILPAGSSTPVTDFRAPFEQASGPCRGVRTVRTTIALSGRAGGQRLRATLIAGLEQPDALRFEAVAPFGPPTFILVAHAGSATLLLPRDNRVLTGVPAADILEALAGIRLDPAALRGILTGCVVADPQPAAGRIFDNGWMAVEVGESTLAYLRQERATWRIVAGLLPGLEVRYRQFEIGLPRQLQIRSRTDQPPAVAVDVTLALSDVATNLTMKPGTFSVDVPSDAAPMTLAELRDAGPLGGKGGGRGPGAAQ